MNKHKNPVDIESYKKGYKDACEMHNHNGFDVYCNGELKAKLLEYREVEKRPLPELHPNSTCANCNHPTCGKKYYVGHCDFKIKAGE